ncbi:MAG: hypothetical protein JW900_13885 [Anaerolineae bacterium]|nr:hypothetical protein [Anaerolineae bacterium]
MAELRQWVWLCGSILLAVAATQGAWWLWKWEKSHARLARFVHFPLFSPLLQIARLLYYVGFPFAALRWGHAVFPLILGLKSPLSNDLQINWVDWLNDIGWAAGLGIAAWSILSLGWWMARKTAPTPFVPTDSGGALWLHMREAFFHETHWSFYRNAPIVLLGPYWGIWAGLALVAVEALLNPWRWSALRQPEHVPALLIRAGLAILSCAVYIQTTNLWVTILVHGGITWTLALLARALVPPPAISSGEAL